MEGLIQARSRRPGVPACLVLVAAAAALLMGFTGCAPAVGDRPEGSVDPVELAHQHARLAAQPEPDPWPDMPAEIRSGIVSDALAGIDPRLSDVEQRLSSVEQRVEKHDHQLDMHINVMTELSQRVSAIENLPQAPAPSTEELEAMRLNLEQHAERLAALTAKLNGCQCGPDCTCGPDCKCPDGCHPNCPCQKRMQATANSADIEAGPATVGTDKPYASVTLLSVPGCPPCEQWKRDVLPAVLEKGWAFSEETLTHGTAPQFRICIGDACYLHQGPLTGNDLARIVAMHEGRAEPVSLEEPGFFGDLFGRRGR